MTEPGATTVIRNASWLIAWDAAAGAHVYLQDADIAFADGRVLAAGARWDAPADHEIDGRGCLVMPGLVNIHCHSADEAMMKGLFDDVGTPALYGNALYTYGALIAADEAALAPCSRVMIAELLRSGVTTLLDLSVPYDGWLDVLAGSGVRAFAAPMFREARWVVENGTRLTYVWDREGGRRAFDAALAVVDAACAHPSGRLSAVIAPSQADTCGEALLCDAKAAADERNLPMQLHAAQLMAEFDEMLARHGTTTTRWLDRLGVLDQRVSFGHGIFLDHHSWTRLRTAEDLPLLAARGVSVAHCPTTFARSGMTLETLGRYREAGVNVGMGTDSYPHNMLEEMRTALHAARIAGKGPADTSTGDIFHAATVGGARALGREDLGRFTPGAAADIVVVDLAHPAMRPMHDPLRSLIHCAAERAVKDVFVAGHKVVADGIVTTIDFAAETAALEEAQHRAIARVPSRDTQGRSLREIAPLSLARKDSIEGESS